MRRPAAVAASALPLAFVLTLVVPAGAGASPGPGGTDDPRALDALRRAAVAAAALGFAGTQLVSAWLPSGSSARLVEVVQRPGGQRWERVRETGDTSASTSTAAAASGVDPTSAQALEVLASAYDLRVDGRGDVAGRSSLLVVAVREGSAAARLWVDDATGLLLRLEVVDGTGRITRMTTFLDVRVQPVLQRPGISAFPALVVRPATLSPRWSTAQASVLRGQGWPCPDSLPGGMRLVDARRRDLPGGGAGAVHLTYTDGLSGLSIFAQPGRLDHDGLDRDGPGAGGGWSEHRWGEVPVLVARGWPARVVWQGGDHVFTVVADAPMDELEAVVAELPHEARDKGFAESVADALSSLLAALPGR